MKQVKTFTKAPADKNFYFTIISEIRKNNKLPNTSKSKQSLNYYVSRLKKLSIIYKLGYGVWGINEEILKQKEVKILGKSPVQVGSQVGHNSFTCSERKIRAHGFVLKLNIPHIAGWNQRKKFLKLKNIQFKEVGINKTGQSINFNEHKIHLFKNSIIIYTPESNSYYGENAESCKEYAIYDLMQLIIGLENYFNVSFKIRKKYDYKVIKQHYAQIENELAKKYQKENKRLKIKDEQGTWAEIDNSLNLKEFETIRPSTAVDDMDKVIIPFFNSLKQHYDQTGESVSINQLMNMHITIFKSQQVMSRNLEEMQELIKKIMSN
jgi:hypothetical protein